MSHAHHLSTVADFSAISADAVRLLDERWARRHHVLPMFLSEGAIVVATADPLDCEAEQAVGFATGRRVHWACANPGDIARALDLWYGGVATPADEPDAPVDIQHLGFATDTTGSDGALGSSSVIRLADELIARAIDAGASDLHLEPEEQGIAVRHRIDGVMRRVAVLPRRLANPLSSRLKILSGLDIADRLRPQDGRARVAIRGAAVDLRVSTLPASHGEKIVVRVLDASAGLRTLEDVGFTANDLLSIRRLLEQREGLVLVTGPTGSGKTTTLYAALREIQRRGVNIVTVEDPIEYRLPGIVQVQVHERAGLTFASALRSIMRQDPDVILIGEIRDRETADIAVQASLTGHLVLSTLHTNDAASAVTRLLDIGVPAYRIATALKGVVAQRLLRMRCRECEGAATACSPCGETGFRGRQAIAEILTSGGGVERAISEGATTDSIAVAARASGMTSLWESGMAQVRAGRTGIEELRRVAASPQAQVAERPAVAAASRRWIVRLSMTNAERAAEFARAAERVEHLIQVEPSSAGESRDTRDTSCDVTISDAPMSDCAGSELRVLICARGTSDVTALLDHADLVLAHELLAGAVFASVLALLRWRAGQLAP